MKYLIDIGHPAHVHYYKNFVRAVTKKGDDVLFTCRDKDVTIELLHHNAFKYINLGRPFRSIPGKMFGIIYFTIRIFFISLSYKPNMFLNATVYSAFVAWLMRRPHLSIEDTFNMEQVKFYLPFTSCVLTGNYSHPLFLNKKVIRYRGYQELMYLHPNQFNPDKSVLKDLGLQEKEPYVLLRFVSWEASHDLGHKGVSLENKIFAVKSFSKYAKVLISSESELPESLEKYKINIPVHKIHDAMAYSSLIFGESATMVSEGAMLGIPGIFLDNTGRFYTRDQEEQYGLVFNYSESEEDQIKAIHKGVELLMDHETRQDWKGKRGQMLADNIDVTAFMIWFIENWPEGFSIIKENPGYQERFMLGV